MKTKARSAMKDRLSRRPDVQRTCLEVSRADRNRGDVWPFLGLLVGLRRVNEVSERLETEREK